MQKPRKEDFEVYELASADPDYKEYNGIVYNNFMYQEALRKYKTLVRGGDLSGVSGREFDVYSTQGVSEGNGGYQHVIQNRKLVITKNGNKMELDEGEIMQVLRALGVTNKDFEKGFHYR